MRRDITVVDTERADRGYREIHHELFATYGKASEHTCSCGDRADEWAFQHSADVTLWDGPTRPYSRDVADYRAMCHRCHTLLDLERTPGLREVRQDNARRATAWIAEARKTDKDLDARLSDQSRRHLEIARSDPRFSEVQYRAGKKGGRVTGDRILNDPEFRDRYRKQSVLNGKKSSKIVNAIRRVCNDCGMECHPGSMGRHLKSSGHSGYRQG